MKINNIKLSFLFLGLGFITQCKNTNNTNKGNELDTNGVSLIVLGTMQDGGAPHIGCRKICCNLLFKLPNPNLKVVSLGLIDYEYKQTWLIEATPDITTQLRKLKSLANFKSTELPNGIFLTHAHIGHYSGLMYLGKEALNSNGETVYAMPKMKNFIETNGPWQQLINQNNISIKTLQNETPQKLSPNLTLIPFLVPHRDEYSETVGYKIIGPSKSALFIPDINKWSIWNKDIIKEIASVDYAFIDATFYDSLEISSRPMSEIPHPFVAESINLFKNLTVKEKNKIYFIHFNHTNPLLNPKSKASQLVSKGGFHIAKFGDRFKL